MFGSYNKTYELFHGNQDIHSKIIFYNDYIVLLRQDDIFWRYCFAFGYAFVALITVASVGFFISVFAENSIGPIITTMSIIVFFTVIGTLNLPIFKYITPYLFTTKLVTWKEFFDEKTNDNNEAIIGSIQNIKTIFSSLVVLIIYIVTLLSASIFVMRRKDILS